MICPTKIIFYMINQPMTSKLITLFTLLLFCSFVSYAQKTKIYQLKSPNGNIVVNIEAGAKLQWSVQHKGQSIIAPSAISLTLQSGEALGDHATITTKTESVNTTISTINYVR